MRSTAQHLVCLAALLSPGTAAAQRQPGEYHATATAIGRRVIVSGRVSITAINVGPMTLDTNGFSAVVSNDSDVPWTLGLGLRAVPGLWVRGNWERGYRFEIPAHSRRRIDAVYVFQRMTPAATLRVFFGLPVSADGGIGVVERFFDTTLAIGQGNPAATDPRVAFETLRTGHFEVFAWRGSSGARQLPAIAAEREHALGRIADLLAVPFAGRIQLVLYPDSATKTSQTGHIGAGFASGRTIVEIFNDSVQLDPYHEIAHVVADERGSPPPFLSEGFAVYASQSLGGDALRFLGAPGRTAVQVVCGYRRSGALIPVTRLIRLTDIGPDSTQPRIAYPEAASVTAFLIDRYGIARFRRLYAQLRSPTDSVALRRNEQIMEEMYGRDVAALTREWDAWLACPP